MMDFWNAAEQIPHHAKKEYTAPLSPQTLAAIFSLCDDFEQRTLRAGEIECTLCWIDGITDSTAIGELLLRPLSQLDVTDGEALLRACEEGLVYGAACERVRTTEEAVTALTRACAVLLCADGAVSFEMKGGSTRSVSEPTLEKSLKGARASFVETLRSNTGLIRRHIFSPQLKTKELTVGRKSQTRLSILYMEDIANDEIVAEVERRLSLLDPDGVLGIQSVEEQLSFAPRSMFPQLLHTERPDRMAMYLLEGRVGILIDGIPVGLAAPCSFADFMKVTSDSVVHFIPASMLSILRYLALYVSILLPGLYTAIAVYHQEMIPAQFLLSTIEAKQHVPFSTAMEIFGMLVAFSLLQEAGLRLPNPVGDTVSIIGALIVGQSAVDAQIVSPIAIIIVAVSGIACYTLPSQDLGAAIRIMRLSLLLASIIGGLYGMMLGLCLYIRRLCSMEGFGVSYTSPLTDERPGGLLRMLLRAPQKAQKLRDGELRVKNLRRQS